MKTVSLASWLCAGAILCLSSLALADECQPHTWEASMKAFSVDSVGKINCRYETTTGSKVNDKTCSSIAKKYETTLDAFMELNPKLGEDCSQSIRPKTTYCVKGFVEPQRAWNGLCGPNHNATCLGTERQCCNSETWKCGDSDEDCQAGVCYEGACFDE